MPTLYWNLDTNLVTPAAFDSSALFLEDTRGSVALRVICTRGDVNSGTQVLLDNSQTVGIVLRDPNNLKGAGNLAGPTTFTRGATAADGYIATVSTDTSVVRDIMHVDDTSPELLEYAAGAVLYAEPTSGDALESLPFSWTILPRYYETGLPPADIVLAYPSAAQMTAAVAAASSAQPRLPTPTANGQFLFGNTDGSVAWGAFPTGLSLSLAGLNVSGAATFGDALNVFSLGVSGNGGIDESGNISGNGAAITDLDAGNLGSGTVPTARLPAAVVGSSHYKGTWDAGANSPALASGTGETGGYYIVNAAGTTTLDGVSVWRVGDHVIFDGTRWDKIDGSANPVATVDGQTGDANGNVTLPSDAAAGTGSKRTLGPGATQAAPGNDTRFPASVTGLRKGAGAGSADAAAVAGVDFLAPNGSGAALSGVSLAHTNGTIAFTPVSPGTAVTATAGNACGDVIGQFSVEVATGSGGAGTTVGTITFATPYAVAPKGVLVSILGIDGGGYTGGASGPSAGLYATVSQTGITFKLSQDIGSTVIIQAQYYVIPGSN